MMFLLIVMSVKLLSRIGLILCVALHYRDWLVGYWMNEQVYKCC